MELIQCTALLIDRNLGITSSDKVPFISRVAEALKEGGGEVEGCGVALAEGCAHHGPYVDHGALGADWQTTAHSRRTRYKLHQQCAHIEHLRNEPTASAAEMRALAAQTSELGLLPLCHA